MTVKELIDILEGIINKDLDVYDSEEAWLKSVTYTIDKSGKETEVHLDFE